MVPVRRHSVARREAVEAMLRDSDDPMTVIAEREGIPYETIRTWNQRLGVRPRAYGRRAPPDLRALNAALRAHIAHQIAAFDAALRRRGTSPDSGRVMRDLAGLKRLYDELAADAARARAAQDAGDGEADGQSPQDIAALRADIARRYAAFEAAEAERAVPEDADGPGPPLRRD